MKRLKTFIDASLSIAAARGNQDISFVHLEVLPKAVFHRHEPEVHFYRAFFARAKQTVKASASLVAQGQKEAEQEGVAQVQNHERGGQSGGAEVMVLNGEEIPPSDEECPRLWAR
jgi:hypothetical protein